jgi:hypothetical protein
MKQRVQSIIEAHDRHERIVLLRNSWDELFYDKEDLEDARASKPTFRTSQPRFLGIRIAGLGSRVRHALSPK